jgi:hypothetical protein
MSLVPPWVYAAALAAVVAVFGVQEVRIANLKADLAVEQAAAATERANREHAAREYAVEIAAIQAGHAAKQQELEDAWTTERQSFEVRRAADSRQLDRLRLQIAAYTTPRPAPDGGAESAPDLDQADRLTTIGSLFAESLDLLSESRAVVEQRDAEVKRLVDQIGIDRAACMKPRLGG